MLLPCQKKNSYYFLLTALLLLSGATAFAQSQPRLSFRLTERGPAKYRAFVYPVKPQPDYSNYPLTDYQIRARVSGVKAYNRMYNTITNRNKNGVVGNLLGLERTKRPRPDLRF